MTDDRAIPPDQDPDILAGELALGLLTGEEQAAALRRVLADRAFAAAVDRWRDHFAQLVADWPAAEPSPMLFDAISRRLDAREKGSDPVAIRRWRWTAGLTTAAAAALGLVVIFRPGAPPPPTPVRARPAPMLIATLNPADQGKVAPIAAIYDPATHSMRVAAAPVAPTDKAAELWVIPADGVPRPMGLLRARQATPMPIGPAQQAMLVPGSVLAVSIEPLGGSPTGKPTGPVVVTGTLAAV